MPSRRPERSRLHALVLRDPERTLQAVRRLRLDGYGIDDVHTPFPVHGMAEAMGIPPTRISTATLVGAAAGLTLGLGLQAWTSVVDWPLDIGGKSYLALPALMPVTFELSVLFAAFATVIGLLVRSRLRPRGEHPPSQPGAGVADDRFVIVIREEDAGFDAAALRGAAARIGVEELIEGWKVF
jgi:hypothetical protein